jgi:Tol biopolymer transport system component
MKRAARAVVALLAWVVVACTGSPEQVATTSQPPTTAVSLTPETLSGSIVFDHEFDIWTMTTDGDNRARLTDDPAEDFDPVWSPDGTMIAFRSHRDGSEEVYVMNADGSDQRNLTVSPRSDYSPEWSPDGSRIAFATDRDSDSGGNDIYTMSVDGTDLRRLTVAGGIDEYPSWSPDGRLIAYACSGGRRLPDGGGDFEVCVMNADGTGHRQLTDAEGVSDYPAWSPDGSLIAFMTTRGGWPTLPDYVPHGYEEGEFGEYEIFVMDANGENPRNVTNNGREGEQFPAWSPDGSYLVFSRYGCLILSTLDGTSSVQITENALCADGFPDWRQSDS